LFKDNQDKKEILLGLIEQMNNDPDAGDDRWRWENSFELDDNGHVTGETDAILNADYGTVYMEIYYDYAYGYHLKINLYDKDEENFETFKTFKNLVAYLKNRFLLN
jgi:ribosome biogenesis GTPase A